jgi:hypothetical protein
MKRRKLLFLAWSMVLGLIGVSGFRLGMGEFVVVRLSSNGEVLSPIELGSLERMVIHFSSEGCSHFHNWHFEIVGGPDQTLVVVDVAVDMMVPDHRAGSLQLLAS